jgi:hypothetical protein
MSDANQAPHQGEFRGDFTRDTFDPTKHFSRVLMQQGRVQLDADWNEQTSILLHYLRSLTRDLIGPHGGPDDGFKIDQAKDARGALVPADFTIGQGRYYVDGILCENEAPLAFSAQSGAPFPDSASLTSLGDGQSHVVFLDVWERHISSNEDRDLCEVALGGPDTATRAQVIWQVKVPSLSAGDQNTLHDRVASLKAATNDQGKFNAQEKLRAFVQEIQDNLMSLSSAGLRARAQFAQKPQEAGNISPQAQYRGSGNQLYRVEIHNGGAAGEATFKWSRDNGSVVFPILESNATSVKLANLDRDSRSSLKKGDWVEVVDDDLALRRQPGPLLQVADIKTDELTVVLSDSVSRSYDRTSTTHPVLRRWDQSSSDSEPATGALLIREGTGEHDKNWIALENGVQIQFAPANPGNTNTYRTGDYWLIPARVATGDVLWPKQKTPTGEVHTYPTGDPIPAAQAPHGVEHHYAPLWIITVADGKITAPAEQDCRAKFPWLRTPPVPPAPDSPQPESPMEGRWKVVCRRLQSWWKTWGPQLMGKAGAWLSWAASTLERATGRAPTRKAGMGLAAGLGTTLALPLLNRVFDKSIKPLLVSHPWLAALATAVTSSVVSYIARPGQTELSTSVEGELPSPAKSILVKMEGMAPTRKVSMGGVAGVATALIVFGLNRWFPARIPPYLAAFAATAVSFVISHFWPKGKRERVVPAQ